MGLACGIDFGTSNSTATLAGDGVVTPLPIDPGGQPPLLAPTLLYFAPERAPLFGTAAREGYLAEEMAGRLLQSIKRHLPARNFEGTWINEDFYPIETLVGEFLGWVKERAEEAAGERVDAALLGRPARFHADPGQDALAQERLAEAARRAGFERIAFQREPIAAARQFERSLDREVLCLVGDIGGGTSDFTLIRLSPARAGLPDRSGDVLGVEGVAVGGNDFDTRFLQRFVLPHFGHNTTYEPLGKRLPIPTFLHHAITRWHTACLANTQRNREELRQMIRTAEDKEGLRRLEELIEEGWFYLLFQSVEAAKIALSRAEEARFAFRAGSISIDTPVRRADFEAAIAREVAKLEACADGLVARAGLQRGDIDVAFLTGGSSQIPAIRQIFLDRFAGRLVEQDAFTSVGAGLGVEAAERPWT